VQFRHGGERLLQLGVPLGVGQVREVRAPQEREDPVGRVDGVVGAERILEDALNLAITPVRSGTPCDLSRSAATVPIRRVCGRALIAYCGTRDTWVIRRLRMAAPSVIGSSVPSTSARPLTSFIRGSR
jgi:hypothetical protein